VEVEQVLQYLRLILKNLKRNRLRTTLTALAVAVLVTICVEMLAVTLTARKRVAIDASQAKLIVSERWVQPSQLPSRYVSILREVPGVEDWTVWSFYGGYYDESQQLNREGLGIATRIENLVEMTSNLSGVDPAALEALRHERSGALVGLNVMRTMGWHIGQEFTFISVTHPKKDLRFRIVGVLPPGQWSQAFFFRHDYYEEGTGDKDTVNCVWLRTRDEEAARAVAAAIEDQFKTRTPELKVETESAGVARFAGRGAAVVGLLEAIVLILLADMVVVLSNSISVATRERRTEMAVLKVLGFRPRVIMGLVIGEAMLIGVFSGLLGAGLAYTFSSLAAADILPRTPMTDVLVMFPVQTSSLLWGSLLGAAVGLAGSIVPAVSTRNVKVADVFAKTT
jgi:putative ABC transport system permease protein